MPAFLPIARKVRAPLDSPQERECRFASRRSAIGAFGDELDLAVVLFLVVVIILVIGVFVRRLLALVAMTLQRLALVIVVHRRLVARCRFATLLSFDRAAQLFRRGILVGGILVARHRMA